MKLKLQKGKAEGSVLLTVVIVMMTVVVFLMSTIALVNASQRRAYYTYYETQAQYAARSALNAITSRAYSDGTFARWVNDNVQTPGVQHFIDVEFNGDVLGIRNTQVDGESGKSTVQCTIERLAEKNYVWDEINGKIYGQDAWKITATAIVGSGRNASSASVSNYIYANPRTSNAGDSSKDTAKWGNNYYDVTPGSTTSSTSGGGGTEERKTVATAMMTFSSIGTANNGSDNNYILGPLYAGMATLPDTQRYNENEDHTTWTSAGYDIPEEGYSSYGELQNKFQAWYGNYGVFKNNLTNKTSVVGDAIIIGSTLQNASGKDFAFEAPKEGLQVYGHFKLCNSDTRFFATYSLPTTGDTDYNNLNYIYVDGYFICTLSDCTIGYKMDSTLTPSGAPVNLYAGGGLLEYLTTNGDITFYNPDYDSYTSNQTSDTHLYAFLNNNVKKTNVQMFGSTVSKAGGDLICNNRSLVIDQKTTSIAGNLVMTNKSGTLKIGSSATVTVGGNLVINGGIDVPGGKTITVGGKVYCDTSNETLRLALKSLTGKSDADILNVANLKDPKYATLTYGGKDYATNVATLDAKYDLSMMPYTLRLDEIHENYRLWDLKSTTKTTVDGYLMTGTNTDPRIKESTYAGHTWTTQEIVIGGTKWYVPSTIPTGDKYFIQKAVIGDAPTANYYVSATNKKTDSTFWDNPAQYKKYLQEVVYKDEHGNATHPINSGADADVFNGGTGQTITFISHDKAGAEKTTSLSNANVILDSCVLTSDQCNTKTIYVDPTQNGYSDDSPLVIFMTGTNCAYNTTIVVNNTMNKDGTRYCTAYKEDDGTIVSYGYAGRSDVVIFFSDEAGADNKVNMNMLTIKSTGCFGMYNEHDMSIIASPYYPEPADSIAAGKGTDAWYNYPAEGAATVDPKKYAFELVPNVVCYGANNVTYELGQGTNFISGEVLALNSSMNFYAGNDQFNCAYYETPTSSSYYVSTKMNMYVIGSYVTKNGTMQNTGYSAYLGDIYRGSSYVPTTDDPEPTIHLGGTEEDASNEQDNGDGDYFSNHHLGDN